MTAALILALGANVGWAVLAIYAIRVSGLRAELAARTGEVDRAKEILISEQGEREQQLAMIKRIGEERDRAAAETRRLHEKLAALGAPGAGNLWDDLVHEDEDRRAAGGPGPVRVPAAGGSGLGAAAAPALPRRK